MNGARLTFGTTVLHLLPDGRVLVVLLLSATPFGATVVASALYPSLEAFLATRKVSRLRV